MKLLLVEDTEQLNRALSTVLRRNSYIVDSAFDGEEALVFLKDYEYDAIILDVMIPKINGIDVLKKARGMGVETPVIMLTAKSTIDDKIEGLDAGADDYLAKPFVTEELLARIRALLRRKPNLKSDKLVFGELVFIEKSSLLKCGDKSVLLMNKEAQIMALLMKNGAKVASLDKISEVAWDSETYSGNENIWVFISYLRKKINEIGSKVKIKSIRFKGYYLEEGND